MNRRNPQRLVIACCLALATSATSCVSPSTSKAPSPPALRRTPTPERVEPAQLVDQVVEAHNVRRAKAGLSPLVANPILGASAGEQARDMASRRKMSHKGGDGSSPFDRMKRNGYTFRAAAENVAFGFDDVESVMAGWMRSPGHRRNILGNFSEVGVARAIASDGASYWCVTFGTPASP